MVLDDSHSELINPNFRFLTNAIGRLSEEIYANKATPELQKSFLDALSQGQILSKLKVLEILSNYKKSFGHAMFIGPWTGLLPYMLKMEGLLDSAEGIELSPLWAKISGRVNRDWNWTSINGDACREEFWLGRSAKIVINTSTEHMSFKWLDYVKTGTYVLAQSTNYIIDEHINCSQSLEDLIRSVQLSKIVSTSDQKLKIYNRFTVFGIK